MQIHAVTEADWARLRAVRLQALSDAPYAFGSTYEREAAFPEATWRDRARPDPAHRQTFLALSGDAPPALPDRSDQFPADNVVTGIRESGGDDEVLGLATVLLDGDRADIVGVWVDPARRGRGIAAALMDAVLDHARRHHARRAVLTVTEGNDPARQLYRRLGFEPTGVRTPLPRDETVFETEMARLL